MNKVGSIVKINPPVRTEEDSRVLWDGIYDITVDAFATDHSLIPLKRRSMKTYGKRYPGLPGWKRVSP